MNKCNKTHGNKAIGVISTSYSSRQSVELSLEQAPLLIKLTKKYILNKRQNIMKKQNVH